MQTILAMTPNNYLIVIAGTENLDQSAVANALGGTQFREWIDGAWLVQTDLSPVDFRGKIGKALGDDVAIFPATRGLLQAAVLPTDLTSFTGVVRAA